MIKPGERFPLPLTPEEFHRQISGDSLEQHPRSRRELFEQSWKVTTFLLLPLLVLVLFVAAAAYGIGARRVLAAESVIPGGNAARGAAALQNFGCGTCHTISGIRGANGKVGPPLDGVAERTIIAGEAANTPETMAQWIRDPQSIEPKTAMPNVGVDEQTARDIVAYLYAKR